jgi:hypothetical protein
MIFHFAGHAAGVSIELNDDFTAGVSMTDMKAFAKFIAKYAKSLKLVFLNGCSTIDQSEHLRNEGVPVVISTELALEDSYAFEFAQRFYEILFNKEKNLSVQSAFEDTIDSFKSMEKKQLFSETGDLKNAMLLHPNIRGNFQLLPNTPREIFRIDGDQKVRAQSFADWQQETPDTQPSHVTDLEKTIPVSGGLSIDDTYLLCDRSQQSETFGRILKGKVSGNLPDPNFIFVNGHKDDGIPELLQRFEKYVLPELCVGCNSRVTPLKFPDPEFFDIPGDEKKPLLHLEEIYRDQLLNKPGQKIGDNSLMIVCHKIYKPFWKDGVEDLFRFYLREYSSTMRTQIGERIIVLFFLVHTDRADQKETLANFTELYKRLKGEKDFEKRMEFFEKLPLIEEGDLLDWHDEVFHSTLDTDKYPIQSPEMYFMEASEYMLRIIADSKTNA